MKFLTPVLAIMACVAGWLAAQPHRPFNYKHHYDATYQAIAYEGSSRGPCGTAVKLPSGAFISAKHIYDSNMDGSISGDERLATLLDENDQEFNGFVVWPNEYRSDNTVDAVIIVAPAYGEEFANVSLQDVEAGEPLVMLGMALGCNAPNIYTGVQSYPTDDNHYRASIAAAPGCSGGGIFRKDTGELIGIVSQGEIENHMFGLATPSWVEYVSTITIKEQLVKDNMEWVLEPMPTYRDSNRNNLLLGISVVLLGLGLSIGGYAGYRIWAKLYR